MRYRIKFQEEQDLDLCRMLWKDKYSFQRVKGSLALDVTIREKHPAKHWPGLFNCEFTVIPKLK